MNWLPHFDSWATAAKAAAVVLPALLILYFLKLRRKEAVVSSTFLWKKAVQDLQVNAPFQKLRKNLLLLLQLLLLLALLVALARPIINYRPGAGKQTVILIDHSASMNAHDGPGGHTRLEDAKRRAKELVDSMPHGGTAMVIAFNDTAETVQPFTEDASTLRKAIDRIEPTDRKTRLKLAYKLAEAQTNFNAEQLRPNADPADIRLFSDGRALDSMEPDLSVKGNLIFEKCGVDNAQNIAIVALSAKRNYERPTQVQIFARLANFGTEATEAPVEMRVDGELIEVAGARQHHTLLLPERWTQEQRDEWQNKHPDKHPSNGVDFKIDLPNAAIVKVEQLNKEGDQLSADDMAQVVVPPPKSLAVLLVTDGNFFLEKAINSAGLQAPDTVTPDDYEQRKPHKYDVIIFDRYKPKFMPEAANFIWFLDGPRAALPDLRVKVAKGIDGKPIRLEDVRVLDWKRDHPILKDLALTHLYVAEACKLEVPLEDEVLLDGLKGPLIALDRTGKYTSMVVAFDVLQSDWPIRVSFPVFLHNALQYLAIGTDMDVRQSLEPGSVVTIPRANIEKIGNPQYIRLKKPDGDSISVAVPQTGDFVLPPLEHCGVYSTDPPVPQFERMAVNLLDSSESNLMPQETAPGDASARVIDQKNTPARMDVWWWVVAFLALPLLLIEWLVYTRRVHL